MQKHDRAPLTQHDDTPRNFHTFIIKKHFVVKKISLYVSGLELVNLRVDELPEVLEVKQFL